MDLSHPCAEIGKAAEQCISEHHSIIGESVSEEVVKRNEFGFRNFLSCPKTRRPAKHLKQARFRNDDQLKLKHASQSRQITGCKDSRKRDREHLGGVGLAPDRNDQTRTGHGKIVPARYWSAS